MLFKEQVEEVTVAVGYELNVTVSEMSQMKALRDRIYSVLENHHKKDEKKIYLSDDDLKLTWAMLSVLTNSKTTSPSKTDFDLFLENFDRMP